MPESSKDHGEHEVDISSCFASSVASEGNIQIFHKEGRQRNVPSLPKLLEGSRNVGEVEVVFEIVAKQFGQTDSNEGVSRKVGENLERVSKQQPNERDRLKSLKVGIGDPERKLF